ncbi:MAG: hypothetical protein C7B43_02455 [Sulfobacillus benefaciens]|uniref:3-oxoacyl-ACP reductase n=1 Tax=Sulfobacillus benefaciens TaxID=453960 RepID=A0A2T2X9T6_9FIRM|nr:MAG: hypothetical protein C7B43_02455 [Sulfobacillus benefaciens]
MDIGVQGKTVLITGSSGDIGRATAKLYAQEGARIIVTYHSNEEGARQTARIVNEFGAQAHIVHLDVGSESSVQGVMDEISEEGGVDILINNAMTRGWTSFPFEEASLDQWTQTLAIGLTGSFLMVRACLPHMRQQRWGRIVNISSEIALYGMNKSSHYAAAKSGLHGFTRSIAKELGPYGILSNVVAPWLVMTDRLKHTLPEQAKETAARVNPLGGAPEAEDVARTILFVGSGWNTYVNGEIIAVDGGAHALPG